MLARLCATARRATSTLLLRVMSAYDAMTHAVHRFSLMSASVSLLFA